MEEIETFVKPTLKQSHLQTWPTAHVLQLVDLSGFPGIADHLWVLPTHDVIRIHGVPK